MHKIIYASRATARFQEGDLESILAASRVNNERVGITGLLIYCAGSFLQLLEGEPELLAATYARIEADPRHEELRQLTFSPVDGRRFPEWTMGFDHVDEDRLVAEVPGFRPATRYPLVSADLISNATVAETLLSLYATNA